MKRDRPLLAICWATVLFGAALLLLPAATRAGFGWLVLGDPAAMDAWPAEARGYATLLHGVLGAVMVGWGAGLLLALRGASAWTVVAGSVACWFVPDTLWSAAQGAWPNVVLNAVFAAAFGLGLWRARPAATAVAPAAARPAAR